MQYSGTRPLLSRLALLALAVALPASPSVLDSCTDCHGSDGMGRSDPMIPVIAGMPSGHIEEAIFAYIDGARRCVAEPRMCAAVARLSAPEVLEVADYFAAQQRGSPKEAFDPALAAVGARLHRQHCSTCHLPPHDDDVAYAVGIPLHGQRPGYIRYAINAYLDGDREALLEAMARQLQQLEPSDLEALVNHYASYQAPE